MKSIKAILAIILSLNLIFPQSVLALNDTLNKSYPMVQNNFSSSLQKSKDIGNQITYDFITETNLLNRDIKPGKRLIKIAQNSDVSQNNKVLQSKDKHFESLKPVSIENNRNRTTESANLVDGDYTYSINTDGTAVTLPIKLPRRQLYASKTTWQVYASN